MRTTVNPDSKTQRTGDDDQNIRHIVGEIQGRLADLRLKTPRALCGLLMREDPDQPNARPDSPLCPECRRLNGGSDGRGSFVPPRRALM